MQFHDSKERPANADFPDLPVEIKADVLIQRGSQVITADTVNIYSEGLFVHTDEQWPIGALVDIQLRITDDAHPYIGEARVVRHVRSLRADGGTGMEMEFTRLHRRSESFRDNLREFDRSRRVVVQTVLDSLFYVRDQVRGNKVEERDFGQPGAGYRRPVLIIHGFLGTRGAMFLLEQRLKTKGFPVVSFPLGTLNVADIRLSAKKIAERVEELYAHHNIEKLTILAHSMGGLIALYYLKKLGGSRRVNRLVTIGTPWGGASMAFAGLLVAPWLGFVLKSMPQIIPNSRFLAEIHADPIPENLEIISIMGRSDIIADPKSCTLKGARNIMIPTNHAGLVVSEKAFATIEQVLREK